MNRKIVRRGLVVLGILVVAYAVTFSMITREEANRLKVESIEQHKLYQQEKARSEQLEIELEKCKEVL